MKQRNWSRIVLGFAEYVDALRVFPRLFVSIYVYVAIMVGDWFMGLQNPNNAQAGFAGAVTAMCVPLFRWYMETGRKWGQEKDYRNDDCDDYSRSAGGGGPGWRVPREARGREEEIDDVPPGPGPGRDDYATRPATGTDAAVGAGRRPGPPGPR